MKSRRGVDISKRRAGVCIPLSAVRSRNDYGAGDMDSVFPFLQWMKKSGLTVLQLLPLNDLAPPDASPYSPISAFALDPLYAALNRIPELPKPPEASARLKSAPRVRFADVRAFKTAALREAFRRFKENDLARDSSRARKFRSYCRANATWLADYALFRILKERSRWKSWEYWPDDCVRRNPAALEKLKKTDAGAFLFHQYVQWILDGQWSQVRAHARRMGILLYGDIPFGLNKQSADVWSRQSDFDFTATMGAPPDQYSETGQAWGLPAYRWSRMEEAGHTWWRRRISRARTHFDLFRLDHAVGFFRTWLIRRGCALNSFDIDEAPRQRSRGERFFRMCLREGHPAWPIAEDLGLIPPYLGPTLKKLKIPGYKITPRERTGDSFTHPRAFPEISLATSGNHDMPPLSAWWSAANPNERDAFWRMVSGGAEKAPRFSPSVRDAVLENIYGAASCLVIFPFQDFFGARERINVPGTVRNRNWTYRMPRPVEELLETPQEARRSAALHALARRSLRL